MKKLFFVAVATLGGFFTMNAQSIHPRVEVAGNFSKLSQKAGDKEVKSDIKPGLRVGAAVEIGLGSSGVFIAPGITYKMEGNKNTSSFKISGFEAKTADSYSLHYLTIPVDLGMRVDLGAVAVSVEAGPYFAYALKGTQELSGKVKAGEFVKDTAKQTRDLFKDKDRMMKRYDVGIGASAAVEFSHFYVRIGSDLGLVNTADKKLEDHLNMKNASFYAGVGFRF